MLSLNSAQCPVFSISGKIQTKNLNYQNDGHTWKCSFYYQNEKDETATPRCLSCQHRQALHLGVSSLSEASVWVPRNSRCPSAQSSSQPSALGCSFTSQPNPGIHHLAAEHFSLLAVNNSDPLFLTYALTPPRTSPSRKGWGWRVLPLPQGTISLKTETRYLTLPLHKLICPVSQQSSSFSALPTPFSHCSQLDSFSMREDGQAKRRRQVQVSKCPGKKCSLVRTLIHSLWPQTVFHELARKKPISTRLLSISRQHCTRQAGLVWQIWLHLFIAGEVLQRYVLADTLTNGLRYHL